MAVAMTATMTGPNRGQPQDKPLAGLTGVPADKAGQLFTAFFTTHPGHAGLGLALAQRLVQLHGGRITAGNRPEGGFRVTVVLPVEPSRAEGA